MENSISRNNLVALFSAFCPQDHRSMQTFQTITRCHKRKSLECISPLLRQFSQRIRRLREWPNHPPRTGQGKGAAWWQSQEFKKTFGILSYRTSNALIDLWIIRIVFSTRDIFIGIAIAVLYRYPWL
jgi:hypothetical protein